MDCQSWMLYVEKLPLHETVPVVRWVSFFFDLALIIAVYTQQSFESRQILPPTAYLTAESDTVSAPYCSVNIVWTGIFRCFLSLRHCQCLWNFDVFLNVVVRFYLINHAVVYFGYITILLNVAVQSFLLLPGGHAFLREPFSKIVNAVVFKVFHTPSFANASTVSSSPTQITKNNCKNFTLRTVKKQQTIMNQKNWLKRQSLQSKQLVLPYCCRHSHLNQPGCAVFHVLNEQLKFFPSHFFQFFSNTS